MKLLDSIFYLNGFKKIDRTPIISYKLTSYQKGYTINVKNVRIPNNGLYFITLRFQPKLPSTLSSNNRKDYKKKVNDIVSKETHRVNYFFHAPKSKIQLTKQNFVAERYQSYYEQELFYIFKRIHSDFLKKGDIIAFQIILNEDINIQDFELYDIYIDFHQQIPS